MVGGTRTATVRVAAGADAELVGIDRDGFRGLMRESSEMAEELGEAMEDRLAELARLTHAGG
jgi:CRP-like cAMP-binding protein